jgi:hypothetical protein
MPIYTIPMILLALLINSVIISVIIVTNNNSEPVQKPNLATTEDMQTLRSYVNKNTRDLKINRVLHGKWINDIKTLHEQVEASALTISNLEAVVNDASPPMLGMGSPTWNNEVTDDTICSGSAMTWANCQAGLGPTVPSNPGTEQTSGSCFWGKNTGTTNVCLSSNSVKHTDANGNLWAWIPNTPGCKTLCQPSNTPSPLHPEECTLSNGIHDLTNPSDPWGTCVSHPSLGYVGANCTGACGAGSTRTDCSGCISDLGLFGDPFKNCRLLNRDNLVDDCKYNSDPTFPTHDWDYQFVPARRVDGSGYHCVDVCKKQPSNTPSPLHPEECTLSNGVKTGGCGTGQLYGVNIPTTTEDPEDQCKAICLRDTQCKTFDYDKKSSQCNIWTL